MPLWSVLLLLFDVVVLDVAPLRLDGWRGGDLRLEQAERVPSPDGVARRRRHVDGARGGGRRGRLVDRHQRAHRFRASAKRQIDTDAAEAERQPSVLLRRRV